MPIYHFEVERRPDDIVRRTLDLQNLVEAKSEALKLAGTLMNEASEKFWDRPQWMLVVSDDAGLTLFQLQVLGAEGPADQNLSRIGFGEGTYDHDKEEDRANINVDGS